MNPVNWWHMILTKDKNGRYTKPVKCFAQLSPVSAGVVGWFSGSLLFQSFGDEKVLKHLRLSELRIVWESQFGVRYGLDAVAPPWAGFGNLEPLVQFAASFGVVREP